MFISAKVITLCEKSKLISGKNFVVVLDFHIVLCL